MNIFYPAWITVERDVIINHDLENSPLYIKTDMSTIGSDEVVWLRFTTAEGAEAGGILIHFKSSPQYTLSYCKASVPVELPIAVKKFWRITKIKTSSDIKLIIHCNEVLVINEMFPDCEDDTWELYWINRDAGNMQFHSHDTASDFYSSPGNI